MFSGGGSPPLRPENIVHHTINTSSNKAPSASSKISPMRILHWPPSRSDMLWCKVLMLGIVGILAACGSLPPANPQTEQGLGLPPTMQPAPPSSSPSAARPASNPLDEALPSAAPIVQGKSRWQPVRWADLPGFEGDALHEAWNAWIRSCERPAPPWAAACFSQSYGHRGLM